MSDLFPTSNYATSLGRGNRIFLNENLTAYRRSVVKKANGIRKNGLLVSVWTIDGIISKIICNSGTGEGHRKKSSMQEVASNVTLLSVSVISTLCPRSCFLFIYVYAFVVILLIIGQLINRSSLGYFFPHTPDPTVTV